MSSKLQSMLTETHINYPEFCPNLTPSQIFEKGAFHDQGGYFRDIVSISKDGSYKRYKTRYEIYIEKGRCLENIDIGLLVSQKKDKNKNLYRVKSGTSLEYWLEKNWISPIHPYGWLEWYCDYYDGKRSSDDERQINRWIRFAGKKKGRWRKTLINRIINSGKKHDDITISPAIRQSLLHWAYELTEEDYMFS